MTNVLSQNKIILVTLMVEMYGKYLNCTSLTKGVSHRYSSVLTYRVYKNACSGILTPIISQRDLSLRFAYTCYSFRNIVLLNDCSYSERQLLNFISDIFNGFPKKPFTRKQIVQSEHSFLQKIVCNFITDPSQLLEVVLRGFWWEGGIVRCRYKL